jgi:transposase
VAGRSATALATWLAAQPASFTQSVEVIAMDRFAGYKTAAAAVVPDAVTVMDPFHVVALAGAKLDLIRQRVQQQTLGRRGHTGDPLYGIRRIARTRIQLLSSRQHRRLTSVLDADEHLAVKVAHLIYQKIIAAYADPNRRTGKRAMAAIIDSIRRSVPAGLEEIARLGRTLWRRRHDILAFFGHHASNGPTEAINGRLEALRRNALGFRISPTTDCAHCSTAAHSKQLSMHSEIRRVLKPPEKNRNVRGSGIQGGSAPIRCGLLPIGPRVFESRSAATMWSGTPGT